jgi:hypothetical protein
VFDFLAHSPFGFWIIAFLIITFDSTLFLSSHQFTFIFGNKLNTKLRITENPYLLRRKEPIITLFAYPTTPFFISSMDEKPKGRRATKQILLHQKRRASNATELVPLALLSLVLVCIVGPIVSLQYGIERGLLLAVPALYVIAFFGAAVVWVNHSKLGLNARDIARICLELTVCPILLPNIFKRIAVLQVNTCTGDLITYFSDDQAEAIRRLEQHIEATAQ